MESVHADTKNATDNPSRRGKPGILAIRLIGKRQALIRTSEKSIVSAGSEDGVKPEMRNNAVRHIRFVMGFPFRRKQVCWRPTANP
jgi:hypothetical protein